VKSSDPTTRYRRSLLEKHSEALGCPRGDTTAERIVDSVHMGQPRARPRLASANLPGSRRAQHSRFNFELPIYPASNQFDQIRPKERKNASAFSGSPPRLITSVARCSSASGISRFGTKNGTRPSVRLRLRPTRRSFRSACPQRGGISSISPIP
jgi:hypothetical protein